MSRTSRRSLVMGVLLVGLCTGASSTQNTTPTQPMAAVEDDTGEPFAAAKVGKTLRTYRLTDAAPAIDGVLDDEVWTVADRIDDFVHWEPENLALLSERTVAQVASDDRFLYVAVRCDDRDPEGIAMGLGRRDNFPPTDRIEIGFDPRHDHLTEYLFQPNPSGVQGDETRLDDTRIDRWVSATTSAGAWPSGSRIGTSTATTRRTTCMAGSVATWSTSRYAPPPPCTAT